MALAANRGMDMKNVNSNKIMWISSKNRCGVQPVEVERETESSIWVNGERRPKDCKFTRVFPDFESAIKNQISMQKNDIKRFESSIESAKASIKKFESMTEDSFQV